jgi:hypothetical protein
LNLGSVCAAVEVCRTNLLTEKRHRRDDRIGKRPLDVIGGEKEGQVTGQGVERQSFECRARENQAHGYSFFKRRAIVTPDWDLRSVKHKRNRFV